MVKNHSDSERGNPLPPYGLLFPISSKGSFICTIPQSGLIRLKQNYGRARCSFVVRMFAHVAMGRRIDPSWGGPIELVLVPDSVPRLV